MGPESCVCVVISSSLMTCGKKLLLSHLLHTVVAFVRGQKAEQFMSWV